MLKISRSQVEVTKRQIIELNIDDGANINNTNENR